MTHDISWEELWQCITCDVTVMSWIRPVMKCIDMLWVSRHPTAVASHGAMLPLPVDSVLSFEGPIHGSSMTQWILWSPTAHLILHTTPKLIVFPRKWNRHFTLRSFDLAESQAPHPSACFAVGRLFLSQVSKRPARNSQLGFSVLSHSDLHFKFTQIAPSLRKNYSFHSPKMRSFTFIVRTSNLFCALCKVP